MSTIETIYHGKPVIGIPFFGDQETNMQKAVHNGYGLKLTYADLNEETFSNALNEILNNVKCVYRKYKNYCELSFINFIGMLRMRRSDQS